MTLKFSHKGAGTQSRAVTRADNYLDRKTEGEKRQKDRKKAEGQKNRRFLRGEKEKGGEKGCFKIEFCKFAS
ncbi:MAG: hypothetical protein IIT60_05810 [Muribaculaceae bacterium]|nr:hypothetical protein [Muribaculaceae bacterium]MBQ5466751.1 hypothetical protein [Muribaculaceae bacterium]